MAIAVWLITSAKERHSSYEIHRAIGVTQKKNQRDVIASV